MLARLAAARRRPLGVGRIKSVLHALKNPHLELPPVIHVAGTNGKGSTIAFLRALLEAQGARVLAYTSPHLVRFHERLYLGHGRVVSEKFLCGALQKVERHAKKHRATFFEAVTAAAFCVFAQEGGDWLLLETGLGGRLDATNVVRPRACVLTPIAYDHQEYLGNTLPKIAHEKAGILKKKVCVIVSPQRPSAARVINARARHLDAPLMRYGHEWFVRAQGDSFVYRDAHGSVTCKKPSLYGAHQIFNAGTAIACVRAVLGTVGDLQVSQTLQKTVWAGRLQHMGGDVWVDSAHNPAAAAVVGAFFKKPVSVVCALMSNRNPRPFLKALARSARIKKLVAVPLPGHFHNPSVLCAEASALGITAHTALSWQKGLSLSGRPVLICGSIYLAGAVLKSWRKP